MHDQFDIHMAYMSRSERYKWGRNRHPYFAMKRHYINSLNEAGTASELAGYLLKCH